MENLCLLSEPSMVALDGLQVNSGEIVERTHQYLLRLIIQGRRVSEVARLMGYITNWVRGIICRYNAEGPAGLSRLALVLIRSEAPAHRIDTYAQPIHGLSYGHFHVQMPLALFRAP